MKVRRWISLGAVALVSLGVMTAAGARPQTSSSGETEKPVIVARSGTPQSCFQSGSGATFFRPCVTIHGNVYPIEAPSGVLHSGIEGYGICSNSGYVYDATGGESGFGAQTVSQPNGPNTFPLSIARSGGGWRLTQTFARDAAQREVNITMALRNTTASAKINVNVFRFIDGDLDGMLANIYDRSIDAAWGRESHALALQAVSLGTPHQTFVQTYSSLASGLANGVCTASGTGTPTGDADYTAGAYYSFPSIAAGATKTVKFTYRIM